MLVFKQQCQCFFAKSGELVTAKSVLDKGRHARGSSCRVKQGQQDRCYTVAQHPREVESL